MLAFCHCPHTTLDQKCPNCNLFRCSLGFESPHPFKLKSKNSVHNMKLDAMLLLLCLLLRHGLSEAQADFELLIFLSSPPKCWDYDWCVPQCPSLQLFNEYII